MVDQMRAATRNWLALWVGAALGGFVPIATYWLAHHEVKREVDLCLQPTVLLVFGGLLYSAKTVWQWGRLAFDCRWKATGFVTLLEGVMVTSETLWLSLTALGYLVAINGLATGCHLALTDRGGPRSRTKKARAPATKRRSRAQRAERQSGAAVPASTAA